MICKNPGGTPGPPSNITQGVGVMDCHPPPPLKPPMNDI